MPDAGAGTASGFSWATWLAGSKFGAAESATANEIAMSAPDPTSAGMTVQESRFLLI